MQRLGQLASTEKQLASTEKQLVAAEEENASLLADFFGITISPGALVPSNARLAEAAGPTLEAMKAAVSCAQQGVSFLDVMCQILLGPKDQPVAFWQNDR